MEIQPIQIFTPSGYKNATWLQVRGIGDNYKESCQNYYELCEVVTEGESETEITRYIPLQDGNCTVDGEDYEDWDNSNEQIVEIVLNKIGLEKA